MELTMRTDQYSIRQYTKKRKWTCIGHIVRKPTANVMRPARTKDKENQTYTKLLENKKYGTTWKEQSIGLVLSASLSEEDLVSKVIPEETAQRRHHKVESIAS